MLEHFHTLSQIESIGDGVWSAVIELNPEHPLYQGHFPEQPVVPGVCMLHLIKEIAECIREQSLQYSQISSAKFLSAIHPGETPRLEFIIQLKETADQPLQILAEGKAAENCFIKLKAQLIPNSRTKELKNSRTKELIN